MDEPESEGLFQGNELSRLMILLAVAAAGWVAIWFYVMRVHNAPIEPEPVVNGTPKPVVPDRSEDFETVTDKKPISLRDMAAYKKLLTRARETTPNELARQARRDIFYAHLWEDPGHYRGVPVHLLGTAKGALYYESKLSRNGWLYEAHVYTSDSQNNPYICVFEDAPKGFPVGRDISERVVFNGYFLKLMRYEAADVPRGAPLLIGRIGWDRPALPVSSDYLFYCLGGGIVIIFSVSFFRRISQFRRSLAPKALPSFIRDRPSEEIAPEELSEFFRNLPEDDEDPPRIEQR